MPAYRCKKCGYIYIDEQQDKPFEHLKEGEFKCPRCKCKKTLFSKMSD